MHRVAIALGSNLGDRRGHLAFAVEQFGSLLHDRRLSSIIETNPEGVAAQPRFLNAAATGRSLLPPSALLEALLAIERARGRERPHPGAPRTLDLDLILYDDRIIDEPGLRVPHPRFRERLFVLQPLAEIAADWRDPETGKSVGQLLGDLREAT